MTQEKTMGLKINLKSFDDLPLLDVQTTINDSKKNTKMDISFPAEYANRAVCFLIGNEIAYFTADEQSIVSIKNKELTKVLQKK
jgi:hypothetical protein